MLVPNRLRQSDTVDIRKISVRSAGLLAACCLLLVMMGNGCSLFVMAGKMIYGDPKIDSAFQSATGVDLEKDAKTVLVVITTPESIKAQSPSLDYDLLDGVTRRLKLRGIDVIDPDDVMTWVDDNGGVWGEPWELAQDFDTDFIVHIDLDEFSFRELNSPTLFRGRTIGNIHGYSVSSRKGKRDALQVFTKEFNSVYPSHHPVSEDQVNDTIFQKRFVDFLSEELGHVFYAYRMGDSF